MRGFLLPIRSTEGQTRVRTKHDQLTDERDKGKDADHSPGARNAVDHQRSGSTEPKSGIDGRSVVVVHVDARPLAHGLDETAADRSVQIGPVGDEVHVRRRDVFLFCQSD